MFRLDRTCFACPEQYDLYYNDEPVGYFRLRHGVFTVEYPYCGGELLLEVYPKGDGIFETFERDKYLNMGIDVVAKRMGENERK